MVFLVCSAEDDSHSKTSERKVPYADLYGSLPLPTTPLL
jgi:hypothetical protein